MILGLDLAQKTGWAFCAAGKIRASGVQDFSKRRGESNGIVFLRFRRWLKDLIALADIPVLLVAVERPHYRGGAATELLAGLHAITQEVAAGLGVETAPVHSGTLKVFACGSGKAQKHEMILAAARILGRDPEDDNEADAVHVAQWAEKEFAW